MTGCVVEQPGYPNGLDVVTDLGARPVPVPVDPRSGDLGRRLAGGGHPADRADRRLPGAGVPEPDRRADVRRRSASRSPGLLDRSGTVAVVDETLVELALDDVDDAAAVRRLRRPRTPVVTVGSASKIAWGGLRVGWLRSDAATVARLAALRSRQDLASPVLEQLALLHLLDQLDDLRAHRVGELRRGRDLLLSLLAAHLPDWRCARPAGGQVLWCALPAPSASALGGGRGGRRRAADSRRPVRRGRRSGVLGAAAVHAARRRSWSRRCR